MRHDSPQAVCNINSRWPSCCRWTYGSERAFSSLAIDTQLRPRSCSSLGAKPCQRWARSVPALIPSTPSNGTQKLSPPPLPPPPCLLRTQSRKMSPFRAWSRSEYIKVYFTHLQDRLPCLIHLQDYLHCLSHIQDCLPCLTHLQDCLPCLTHIQDCLPCLTHLQDCLPCLTHLQDCLPCLNFYLPGPFTFICFPQNSLLTLWPAE